MRWTVIIGRLGKATGLAAQLLLLAALAVTVAACGGSGDTGAAGPTAPATTAAPDHQEWKRVAPGGDCKCADGSKFAFWERGAAPTKVVFYLDGGGACFDAETCGFTGLSRGGEANYDWSIYGEDPAREGGIYGHRILESRTFYELEVNGEKLVDWVSRLIEGEPVDDVHCKNCRGRNS
jgi:hypothetical protein